MAASKAALLREHRASRVDEKGVNCTSENAVSMVGTHGVSGISAGEACSRKGAHEAAPFLPAAFQHAAILQEPPAPLHHSDNIAASRRPKPTLVGPPSPDALVSVYLQSLSNMSLGRATNLHMAWVDLQLPSTDALAERTSTLPPMALWSSQALQVAYF